MWSFVVKRGHMNVRCPSRRRRRKPPQFGSGTETSSPHCGQDEDHNGRKRLTDKLGQGPLKDKRVSRAR